MAQLQKDTVEKSSKPVIIEAFATWCPHCTKMRPLFDQLEKELGDKYLFAAFDVDQDTDLTSQYNILSLPTFIFIKDKKEAGRAVGEMSADDLKSLIEKHLQ